MQKNQRHGQERARFALQEDDRVVLPLHEELLDLDEVLNKLATADAEAAEVVKLRLFTGMTVKEIADVQKVSPRTVKRNWAYARAWLGHELAQKNA